MAHVETSRAGNAHGSTKSYLIGFVLCALLTVVPFALVMNPVLSRPVTLFLLVGFAGGETGGDHGCAFIAGWVVLHFSKDIRLGDLLLIDFDHFKTPKGQHSAGLLFISCINGPL